VETDVMNILSIIIGAIGGTGLALFGGIPIANLFRISRSNGGQSYFIVSVLVPLGAAAGGFIGFLLCK